MEGLQWSAASQKENFSAKPVETGKEYDYRLQRLVGRAMVLLEYKDL